MTTTAQSRMTLPAAGEMKAAVQGQRALAAYLATQFETQHIQIFDDRKQAHQVELPTSALRLLVDILAELADGNAVKVVPVHAEFDHPGGGRSAQRVSPPLGQTTRRGRAGVSSNRQAP